MNEIVFFSVFMIVILAILLVDLVVIGRNSHTLSFREALGWTLVWVALSLSFYILLRFSGHKLHDFQDIQSIQLNIEKYRHDISIEGLSFTEAIKLYNHNLSLEYLTGYIIEYSLSVDNIFVILMIFLSFNIPTRLYKKVLFWGIFRCPCLSFYFHFRCQCSNPEVRLGALYLRWFPADHCYKNGLGIPVGSGVTKSRYRAPSYGQVFKQNISDKEKG